MKSSSGKKTEKRVRKKIEPFVWSYQVLYSLFYTSLLGIAVGLIVLLIKGELLNVFGYLLIPVFLFSQYVAFKARSTYVKAAGSVEKFILISALLMALIEGFLILKYFALLAQFLIILGVASAGLAFIGVLGGVKTAEKFKIRQLAERERKILLAFPFVWFGVLIALFALLPKININPQLFSYFALAPSFSLLSAVNNEFVQSLSGSKAELKSKPGSKL